MNYVTYGEIEIEYTWSKLQPSFTGSRLDFFLVTEALSSKVKDINIKGKFISDHCTVELILQFSEITRGPGIWKLNTKLLQDPNFLREIEQLVETVTEYDMKRTVKWEFFKHKVGELARNFSRNSTKDAKNQLEYMRKLLHIYEMDYLSKGKNVIILKQYKKIISKSATK